MKQIREVRIWDLITYWIVPALLIPLLILLDAWLIKNGIEVFFLILACIASTGLLYWMVKRFAIGTVLAYKAFAPMSVRRKCRFEPTCSSYMIMAINRYGLFVGVYKGIRRILRCHPPNGGIDYP